MQAPQTKNPNGAIKYAEENISNTQTLAPIRNENFQANFMPLNFTSSNRVSRKDVPIVRFDESVRCPCCGERMKKFDKTEARKFAKEISKKKGTDLADDLRRNMKKFQANKRSLVREIIRLAPKYPDKKLSEILGVLSLKYTDILRMKQIVIAMQISREIDNITPENESVINKWQVEQIQRIINASEEGDFRNKHLVASFIKKAKEQNIEIDEDKIRTYFDKLPSSKKDPAAFVVKYQRRDSREAAYRLLKNVEPTIEHIIPFAESRNNHTENLLVMCSDCNTIRGSMSYDDFITQHPEMLQNIDKYFADIRRVINTSKDQMSPEDREQYKTYVQDVQATLEKYSPEYFDFRHRH